MKKIAVLFLITGQLCSCKQEIQGTIDLRGKRPVRLWNDEGVAVDIGKGPTTIRIDSKRWFFDSKFEIETNKGKWTINVPKSAFLSDTDFNLKASIETQPIDIEGKKVTELLRSYSENGTTSCTAPGYCSHPETVIDSNGNTSTVYTFGYYYACSGIQAVRYRVDNYKDHFKAIFSTKHQNYGEIGTFEGSGTPYIKRYIEEYLSSCDT